jgi:hypothetical protein
MQNLGSPYLTDTRTTTDKLGRLMDEFDIGSVGGEDVGTL